MYECTQLEDVGGGGRACVAPLPRAPVLQREFQHLLLVLGACLQLLNALLVARQLALHSHTQRHMQLSQPNHSHHSNSTTRSEMRIAKSSQEGVAKQYIRMFINKF